MREITLFSVPISASEDSRLAEVFRFAGVSCNVCSLNELGVDSSEASAGGAALSGATFTALLAQFGADRGVRFLNHFKSIFIYGVSPQAVPLEDLRLVTGPVVTGYVQSVEPTSRVTSTVPELCGPLSSLAFEGKNGTITAALEFNDAGGALAFIQANFNATMLRVHTGKTCIYLWCGKEVIDLEARVSTNFTAAEVFPKLVPFLLYVRDAFPELCWKPCRQQASLIIDDPLLRARYGFLDIVRLLQVLERSASAANVAFIPWNCDRSRRGIAEMVRHHKRFAICIHGCDHTRAEFGSSDKGWLDLLAVLAAERMNRHQEKTGIVHEQVMVFPQGIFSAEAMSVLKRRNFIGAVNTEVVPNHHSANRGTCRLGDLLAVSSSEYDSFPLFIRRSCSLPLTDYALDLFLGKPCLLVAHHDYFRAGFEPFEELAAALNRICPRLEWRTLGDLLEESYCWRSAGVNAMQARMFANKMLLKNIQADPVQFEIEKIERDVSSVRRVAVDGIDTRFGFRDERLVFSVCLKASQIASIKVEYHEPARVRKGGPGVRHRAKSAARRFLSEIRDDYVQPLQHLLARPQN